MPPLLPMPLLLPQLLLPPSAWVPLIITSPDGYTERLHSGGRHVGGARNGARNRISRS